MLRPMGLYIILEFLPEMLVLIFVRIMLVSHCVLSVHPATISQIFRMIEDHDMSWLGIFDQDYVADIFRLYYIDIRTK